MQKTMIAALVSSAMAVGNASDYVVVPGVYFPGSTTKAAGVVPSASSMVRVCRATKVLSHSHARSP